MVNLARIYGKIDIEFEVIVMLFPFLTLPDGTEVVYSDIIKKNGKEHVLVKFERWSDIHDDFDSMECLLPNGKMTNIKGFTKNEVIQRQDNILDLQDMIMECAREDTEEMLCQS